MDESRERPVLEYQEKSRSQGPGAGSIVVSAISAVVLGFLLVVLFLFFVLVVFGPVGILLAGVFAAVLAIRMIRLLKRDERTIGEMALHMSMLAFLGIFFLILGVRLWN